MPGHKKKRKYQARSILFLFILIMGSILIILNKPKITGFVVYKSENFTNETTSAINKNLLNINEIITESTTTLTNLTNITDLVNVTSGDINVNISNQAIPKLSYVTFDRLLDCQGCGLHRAPGLTIVNMTISISVNGTLNNVTIKDYFSNDWTVVNGGNAVVKRINQTTSEIAWNLESINNLVTLMYEIESPRETRPTTRYNFYSDVNSAELFAISDEWMVVVSDAKTLSSVAMTAPTNNQTIKAGATFTITCTPTCSGTGANPDIIHSYQSCGNPSCTTNVVNISTSATTTNPISVANNPETAACNSASSDTITGRNDGSLWIRCYAQESGTSRNAVSSPTYNITVDGNSSTWLDPRKNETTVFQNMYVNFSSNWTDNLALNSFIFSIDQGSGYVNSTVIYFGNGLKDGVSSNITFITAAPSTNVSWKFIVNDSVNNFNETGPDSFLVSNPPDTIKPLWNFTAKNETNVYQNTLINFSVILTDETALQNAVFSINLTGNFVNSSIYSFSGGFSNISNVTRIDASPGTNVTWFWFFNDSSGNSNATDMRSFSVQDVVPTWISGSVLKNQSTVLQNMYVNFSANWTDDIALDSFIFSIDQGSGYVNSSSYKFGSATGNISTNVTFVTAPYGNNVSWKFIVNDSVNNFNETGPDSFNVTDITTPLYQDVQRNLSLVKQTNMVNFTANLTDNNKLKGFIFSIDLGSGFINSSFSFLSLSTHNISNITRINAPDGTNITWFFYFNDTFGNSNTTGLNSFIVVDNTTPTYVMGSVLKNQSSVLQNMFVNFSSNWTDNVALDSFIFEINHTNLFRNSSSYKFGSATGNTSSNITFITVAIETNVSWRFWVNDSSSNWNYSGTESFLVSTGDATKPLWNLTAKNETVVYQNTLINFSVIFTDETELGNAILSINLTGNFVNSSPYSLIGTFTNISNVTRINALQGNNVTWFWFFNDSSGNNNITDMKSFIVVDNTTPLYNLTAKNQTKVFSNDLINFSALVSDNIRLQGFIFSINLTNNFVNSSFVSLTDSFHNISNITRINALQGINVTYFFWFNDTSGNNNYTQWQSFLVEDNTTPLYNNTFKNESAVYENILINFSTIITDNFRLDRFVFSINLTGNFVNSSFIPLSATFHNVSNVTRIIASQGNNVTWFFWFNDTFGNSNYTQWQSFTVIDDTTPLWNLTLKNQSTIFQNDLINFSIILSDNVALSNAVFSINQDGIFKNSSIYILTGKYANLSNETRITSSVGTNVTWFWFFNDSSGNNNITDMKSFIVNDSVPPVLISGTSQIKNQTTINQNMYVNFSANWTDDVALDSFIFSLDTGDGGGFKNSTFIKFSANNISSNVTLFGTNFIGNNISWKFIANDTSANYNETKPDSFNLTDSLLPNFTATMQNITSVRQNEIVNFSANLTDNYKLKGFVFSINLGSGFMNNSFAYISNTFYVVSNETRITSSVGTNVTWFFVYNDTFDNQNVTLMRSFIIADNTTPVFIIGSVLKNETNVYQDYFVNFSANWTDDVALGSFIFSLDTGDGSGYRNSSSYRFGSITGNISSNISFFSSSLISNNISWKLIVNDSSNNWNETSPNSFNLSDNIKPLSSDFQINQTTIYNNQYANFTANLTDNYKLQGFIFSVNLTGNFVNSSFIPLSATFHNVSNVTQIKSQEGNNVSYFFYFNDTFGNSNKTEVRSFIVADNTKPLFNDAQKNMTVVLQNTLVNFTANLTDNVNLAGYLFSINLGSGFINSSYTGLLGAAYNISNITEIRAAQSVNVTWFFYFNDTSGNSNTTGLNSFIVVDNTTPTYVMGSVLKNQSSVLQNMFVNFSSNWTDNVAMDSFIFSIDQGSGYINSSSYKFGSATGNTSSNITFITAAPSTNVSWKFVVNDSSSNWNETGPDSFRALSSTAPNPNVTIDLPPSGVSTLNFRVNISVKSINTIDSCYYNITKGASQEVGQTLIANCNTNDSIYAVVSSDGAYVLRTFVNDSLGKENSTETKSFVVSIEAGGGVGGGGGGGTRITQNISIPDTFSLDRYIINVSLIPNQIKKEFIKIINNQDQAINVSVDLTNLKEFITFLDGATKHIFTLLPKEEKLIQIIFSASADIKPDLYSNAILVSSNGVSKIIYVIIEVESENPLFDSLINIEDKDLYVVPGSNLVAEISVFNIRKLFGFVDVNLDYEIRDLNGNLMLYEHETRGLRDRLTFTKKFFISRNFDPGTYILYIKVTYKGTSASSTRMFYVERGFSLRLPNYLLPSNQRLTTIVFQLIVLTALLIIYAKLKYKFKYGGKNKKIKIYKKETRIAKVYKPIVVSEKSKELVVIKDYKDKENKDNIK